MYILGGPKEVSQVYIS